MHNDPANLRDLWGLESFGEDPDHYLYLQDLKNQAAQQAQRDQLHDKLTTALEMHKSDKYTGDYQCDDFQKAWYSDAGINVDKYFNKDNMCVAGHIELAKEDPTTIMAKKAEAPDLRKGADYLVLMTDSTVISTKTGEPLIPHCGEIYINENETVTFTHNSSGPGGVEQKTFNDVKALQNYYDYETFYYRELTCPKVNY